MKPEVFYLSTKNESHHLKIYECYSPFAVLGTSTESIIPFHFLGVSERHCRIESKYNHFIIKDLRSDIGTFVNKTKIIEAVLQEGDEIQIGEQKITFHLKKPKEKNEFKLKSKNQFWSLQLQSLPRLANSNYPVLILGPSGSGKEIIAQSIHEQSERNHGPFISVNCSALTETLIESELFGHTKGSFTGAIADRKGAFEAARGGTLFLDEIGDLPYPMQAKLLRALENKEIRPVGSDKNISTDVRIVAATHQNLREHVQSGKFRSDLFYRLNVININIPALSDRMEDFDDIFFNLCKDNRVRFDHESHTFLKDYNWPGNIRELKNIISRASAKYPYQTINKELLPQIMDFHFTQSFEKNNSEELMPAFDHLKINTSHFSNNVQKENVIKDYEKKMILTYLDYFGGNQRRTALQLGMPKSTLNDRIKSYNINIEEFKVKGGSKKKLNLIEVGHF